MATHVVNILVHTNYSSSPGFHTKLFHSFNTSYGFEIPLFRILSKQSGEKSCICRNIT